MWSRRCPTALAHSQAQLKVPRTSADTSAMSTPRVRWVYVRGNETIRVEAWDDAGRSQLHVCGPDTRRRIYDFDDALALVQHQADYEAHLLALGYSLERFTSTRARPECLIRPATAQPCTESAPKARTARAIPHPYV